MFDRRVMDHLLDCSKTLSQLKSASPSQIKDLHKSFSNQGIFFQRDGDLAPLLKSFVASGNPHDTKPNTIETVASVQPRDRGAFLAWYTHVAPELPSGRYLLLLQKDLHAHELERTGVGSLFSLFAM